MTDKKEADMSRHWRLMADAPLTRNALNKAIGQLETILECIEEHPEERYITEQWLLIKAGCNISSVQRCLCDVTNCTWCVVHVYTGSTGCHGTGIHELMGLLSSKQAGMSFDNAARAVAHGTSARAYTIELIRDLLALYKAMRDEMCKVFGIRHA